jgi:hypothetical protein
LQDVLFGGQGAGQVTGSIIHHGLSHSPLR